MSFIKTFKSLKRLRQISNVLFKEEMGYVIDRLRLKKHLDLHKKLKAGEFIKPIDSPEVRLRRVMETLGATFVKFGQLLSLRYDALPAKYCDEFSKLQDDVPQFPYAKAKSIIETELNKPITEIFKTFNPTPIAAASVGQVHVATLKTGEVVAVKVQRPKVEETFHIDIGLLHYLADMAERHYPELEKYYLKDLVKEFEKYTERELNYKMEAKNIDDFYNSFKDNTVVKIPKVYWDYTTRRVLVMEYVKGVKISDVDNFRKYRSNKKQVVENVLSSVVKQIFVHKIFHADPHPGNIFLRTNNKIAFLDFGIVGRLTPEMVENIEDLVIGVVKPDINLIAKSFVEIGTLDDSIDLKAFKTDLVDAMAMYYNTSLKHADLRGFFMTSLALSSKYNLKLPLNFVLLIKCITTLEGFCIKYYPDINVVPFMRPYVTEMVKERASPRYILNSVRKNLIETTGFLKSLPSDFHTLIRTLKGGTKTEMEMKDLREFTIELDRSSNRMTYGMIIAALIIASAMIIKMEIHPIYYGIPFLAYISLGLAIIMSFILFVSIAREGSEVKR
ncbi:MAG: AarF/ABC1/UbiB kinase family protein [Candidatus Woesearchaeota archaeon]